MLPRVSWKSPYLAMNSVGRLIYGLMSETLRVMAYHEDKLFSL